MDEFATRGVLGGVVRILYSAAKGKKKDHRDGGLGIGVFAMRRYPRPAPEEQALRSSVGGMRTPLASRAVVRILYSPARTKKAPLFAVLRSGRGIGIRTPTYRVRVCCAAVTQFPCVLTDYIISRIIRFVNRFFDFYLDFFIKCFSRFSG